MTDAHNLPVITSNSAILDNAILDNRIKFDYAIYNM